MAPPKSQTAYPPDKLFAHAWRIHVDVQKTASQRYTETMS